MWERIGQFDRERGSWAAWLTALTRNTALNRARSNARHGGEALSEQTPSQEPGPEETVLQRERPGGGPAGPGGAAAGSRALLYRKYYYRQSTAQIAAELGLTERAVEGKLYRLKKRLRKSLGGEGHAGT